MKLTLGFSPCPNDTFIFDALVNGKIDAGPLEFDVLMEDVQTLNEWALQGKLDVSKVSYGVLPKLLNEYVVQKSGGAMGMGVGPLLISSTKNLFAINPTEAKEEALAAIQHFVNNSTIAIPGENTTAHFLFAQAFPNATKKVFLRFDEIEPWVQNTKEDRDIKSHPPTRLGVIIHENRFTYAEKGLFKWADLGALWENKTGLPIPLGGIVSKKTLPIATRELLDIAVQKSLAYAWKHYPALPAFVTDNAREMKEEVMRQHIDLYVNNFSMDMQENGRKAIMELLKVMGNNNSFSPAIFSAA